MDIVIASHNGNKVREFRAMLKSFPDLEIFSLSDFPDYPSPEETGVTFEENAILKATLAAKELNKWILAEDSGLVVPILSGEPGVYSARYAGANATDLENRRKLLKALENKSGLDRSAYFECVIALSNPEGNVRCVKGICEGFITEVEKGRNGFGYDSIFIKNDYHQTFAELDPSTKNRVSHRRKALDKLMLILDPLIQKNQ